MHTHIVCEYACMYGAIHKARHARGGGVREGVTVCDRRRGPRACDVAL